MPSSHDDKMKRFLRIVELTKNEQRVVLIVVFVLIAIGLVGYERRIHRVHFQTSAVPEVKTLPSPTPSENAE